LKMAISLYFHNRVVFAKYALPIQFNYCEKYA